MLLLGGFVSVEKGGRDGVTKEGREKGEGR